MPKNLPKKVAEAFAKVKKAYGHRMQVKVIKGTYCLFEAKTEYDSAIKGPISTTTYLGWITPDGIVVPARHHKPKKSDKDRISRPEADEIPEANAIDGKAKRPITEKHEREILRALSMNARITVPELAKMTGLKRTSVNYHLKNLEKRYDIKYLLEIDIEKFGYMNYVAFLKFKDKKPSYEEMKNQLEAIPYVQVAMSTKGTYDMAIFIVVGATSEARFAFYKIMNLVFPDYEVDWTITPAYPTFGFIPLRDKFFETLKEKVWTRTKERPKPTHDEITEIEFKALKAINNNANVEFTSIDKEIGADNGRSNYAYHQLMKRGIIKRATISLSKTRIKYNAVFIIRYAVQKEFSHTSDKLLFNIIREEKQQFDTYLFTGDIASPAGIILITTITNEDGIGLKEQRLLDEINGIKINNLIITDMIIGMLDNRLFDKTFTKQYELLISEYNYEPKEILPKTE